MQTEHEFFSRTTLKRSERKKEKNKRGEGRKRENDKEKLAIHTLGGFILRSRLFYFGHAFLGQFFSNRFDGDSRSR